MCRNWRGCWDLDMGDHIPFRIEFVAPWLPIRLLHLGEFPSYFYALPEAVERCAEERT